MPDSKDRKEATGPGVVSTDRGMEQMKDGKDSPHPDLDAEEAAHVEERSTGSAKVVHEVVRLQGEEELDRPILEAAVGPPPAQRTQQRIAVFPSGEVFHD